MALWEAISGSAQTPAAGAPRAAQVKLGAYVVGLYDLNPNNNTFAADL